MIRYFKPLSVLSVLFFICIFPPYHLNAQDKLLDSYERQFIRARLDAKADVLRDAALDERAEEFYGALCDLAIGFAVENAELFRGDPDLINLMNVAVRGAGETGYSPAAEKLWEAFIAFRDNMTRVEILNALSSIGLKNSAIAEKLSQFLADQNKLFRSGVSPDYPVLRALIAALEKIGDEKSYDALFQSALTDYPEELAMEASSAIGYVDGDLHVFLSKVILQNAPGEKLEALKMGLSREDWTIGEKASLAETALEAALAGRSDIDMELRLISIEVIRQSSWTRAQPLVQKHFNLLEDDLRSDPSLKKPYLDSIACLGAMGNTGAADILRLRLGLLNSGMEESGVYDEDIAVALINALGNLRDKGAYSELSHISILPYSPTVKTAALNAIARLSW